MWFTLWISLKSTDLMLSTDIYNVIGGGETDRKQVEVSVFHQIVNSGLYSLLNNKQISKISKHLFHGYLATGAGDL